MYTIQHLTHEQWLEERKKGIGSSEVGVLMGLSHFKTPLQIWRLKMGIDAPDPENDVCRRGHILEPAVAQFFVDQTGAIIDPASADDFLAIDNDRPYLRVSPDRIFWPKDTPKEMQTYDNAYILECKTTKSRILKDRQGNWLYHDYWYAQVQYQMGVMGIKKAVIEWLGPCIDDHGYAWVDFNPAFYRQIVNVLDKFWNENILKKIQPETVADVNDAKLRWPEAVHGKRAVANQALCELIRRRNKVNEIYSKAKSEKEAIETKVKIVIADNEEILDGEGNILVTYKNSKVSEDFDKGRFNQDYPELYAQYLKSVTSRRIHFNEDKKS